ncbi:MAG TPA: hypothetical protein VGL55_08115 [Steroidobacteraceae bacterium]|jgi:hypothetical protein
MHVSKLIPRVLRTLMVLLPLGMLPVAWADGDSTPLINRVHNATARYTDINVAIAEGWVTATPCVSGPDTGAMGVHLVLPSRISAGVLNARQPEALIYEPMANGAMRLVGVEFIVLASVWEASNPAAGAVPALDGNLLNYIAAPNRYGLPAFYELHVWAWEHNPKGSYADWNTQVTCDHQPLN